MTEEELQLAMQDTKNLLAYANQIKQILVPRKHRLESQKLYLSYILDFAIGTADSIIALNNLGKTRDSFSLCRSLFEAYVDAHYICISNNPIWTNSLLALNNLETINAIGINTSLAGVHTEAEVERVRSAKEHLAQILTNSNNLPAVGAITARNNHIISYNPETDTYKGGRTNVAGCADLTIRGRCKLIDATIKQDDEIGQLSQNHHQTIYKYYSQFTHPSLLGMTEYRNGLSEQETVSLMDVKIEFKYVFYYLFGIAKLIQERLPVSLVPQATRQFSSELHRIGNGDIMIDII